MWVGGLDVNWPWGGSDRGDGDEKTERAFYLASASL